MERVKSAMVMAVLGALAKAKAEGHVARPEVMATKWAMVMGRLKRGV